MEASRRARQVDSFSSAQLDGTEQGWLDVRLTRMKNAVIIVVALLAGLLMGSWNVKVDLRRAEKEVAVLRKELNRRPVSGGGQLSGIKTMLKIPERAEGGTKDEAGRHRKSEPEAVPGAVDSVQAETAGTGDVAVVTGRAAHPHGRHGGFRKQMETGMAAWKARSDLARAGFVANVVETEAQAVQFDVVMMAMNLRLSNSVRTWVESIRQTGEVNSEAGIRIMNELSSALVQSYNDLDRTMPADWRDRAGSEFEVINFINPDVIMPLADVEDVIRKTHDTAPPENTPHAGAP